MRWQVMWQCSALIGFVRSVLATEFCMECRPLELQRAPGLGIDLSMSHGTAAMKFRNGTILDLVQLPGSPEYVSVMKTLAEDALRVRAGERSSYLSVLEYEPGRPISFAELLSSPSVSRLYQYLTHQVQPSPHESHPLVREITAMLSALKTAVQEKQSLLYPLLIISIPDFEADTHHIYKSFFKSLAQRVGFNLLHSPMLASLRALEFYGIDDCWGSPLSPEPPCPPKEERSDVVLTITYSNISLGVTLLTRKAFEYSWGAMWPQSVSEAFDLGRDVPLREQEPEKYWREIENVILGTIGDAEKVDNIIFLGSQGGDEELRKVVREVMDGHGEREAVATDTRNAQESLFITARGSAAAARRGMIDGFDGCLMPNHCETDEGKSEL